MHERRRATRWGTNKQAKIKLAGAEHFIEAYLLDINFKGLQISLRPKLPRDTVIKFTLVLAKEFTLEVEAWLAWHRAINSHNIYGLYFTRLSDSDKEKIYKFVFKHSRHAVHKQWWKDLPAKEKEIEVKKEKGGETMEDRRIFERFPAQMPMRLLDLASGQESRFNTCDVSAKGVGLMGNAQLVQRAPVEVWLEIPDKGEPLYARGEVAWSSKVEPGVWRAGINLEKADFMGLGRILRT